MSKGLNLLVTFIPSCLLQNWKLLPNFLGLGCLFCFHFFVVLVFCGIYRIVITGFCLRENNWLLHPSFIFAVNQVFGQVGSSWSCSRNQAERGFYCLRAHCGIVSVQSLAVMHSYGSCPKGCFPVLVFGWAFGWPCQFSLYCCSARDTASIGATGLELLSVQVHLFYKL